MTEIIIDLLIYIPMIALIIVVLLLLQKVQEYRDEVKYLKSTLEQAIEVSTKAENEAKEAKKLIKYHIDKHYQIAQNKFYQEEIMIKKLSELQKKVFLHLLDAEK